MKFCKNCKISILQFDFIGSEAKVYLFNTRFQKFDNRGLSGLEMLSISRRDQPLAEKWRTFTSLRSNRWFFQAHDTCTAASTVQFGFVNWKRIWYTVEPHNSGIYLSNSYILLLPSFLYCASSKVQIVIQKMFNNAVFTILLSAIAGLYCIRYVRMEWNFYTTLRYLINV